MADKSKKKSAAVVAALIIGSVFTVEGGFVDDKRDPGGATNHGITEAVARQNGWTGNMRDLPKEFANDVYFKDYIKAPGFEPMLELSPAVSHKLVDAGVNAGPSRSARWLQVALNSLNRDGKDYLDVPVDGKVGRATIGAYQGLMKRRGSLKACQMVIKLVDAQQAMHYVSLSKMETFTPGWVDNRVGNVPVTECDKDFG